MSTPRTRLIALYCVEPEHDGHDNLIRFPDAVPAKDCLRCLEDAHVVPAPPSTRHLLKVELVHLSASYTLFVTQVTRERRASGVSEGHMLFAPCNLRQKLVPAPRFHAKTFASLPIDPALVASLVHRARLLKAESDAQDAASAEAAR